MEWGKYLGLGSNLFFFSGDGANEADGAEVDGQAAWDFCCEEADGRDGRGK